MIIDHGMHRDNIYSFNSNLDIYTFIYNAIKAYAYIFIRNLNVELLIITKMLH